MKRTLMEKNSTGLRIAFATPGAVDGGGIARMTGYIVDQFARRRRESPQSPDAVVLDTRGVGSVALSPFYLAMTLGRLSRMLLRRDVALVHINVSERGSVLRKIAVQMAADLFKTPTVVHLHGASFIEYFHSGFIARTLARWLFRRCARAIVLGHSWRDFLVREVGVDPTKVDVLYNAVPDFAGPDAGGPDAGRPDGGGLAKGRPVRLLVLAHLTERKGIGTLLQSCRALQDRGLPFQLTLGGNGDEDGYRRMAERLGIAEHCAFLGWVTREQAHALIRSHDILLLPSTHEGLPMVILEALCAQLPVITTAVGSIPEVLTHRETALIVPVNDSMALADAVQDLVGDEVLHQTLAKAGRALFERRFHIKGYCERLCAIYSELRHSHPHPRDADPAENRQTAAASSRPSLTPLGAKSRRQERHISECGC